MKNTKGYYSIAGLLSIVLFVISCEKSLDSLELATYPTTPEVFIDGFSAGMYYAAYGTSNVTAFSVDTEVKYQGSASMKFEVPTAGDPNGSYAGGVFGTNPGRDLTGYNVMTFWAKASQPATIVEVGMGNDMGASKNRIALINLSLNSNWKKFYVPIPDPSVLTQERGLFFYSAAPQDGAGFTFWIDEVKFENVGTIAHPVIGILGGRDSVRNDVETEEQFQITNLFASYNLPTGIDQQVQLAASYFKFASSDPSVATVDSFGVVHVVDSGMAVITAKVKDVAATGSLTIHAIGQAIKPLSPAPVPTENSADVISLYSNAYTNVPVDTWNTYWLNSTAQSQFIQIQGDDVIRYTYLNFVGIEFVSQQINASTMTHFHLDIWTPDATTNKTFKVKLVSFGADGAYGGGDDSNSEVSITGSSLISQNWISLDLPMAAFSGLTTKTHLAQLVLSGDLPNIYLDNVYFYRNGSIPTEPATAAPVPTFSAADVISIFSDSYTNLAGTNLDPFWGQSTVVTLIPIGGNSTMKMAGLNYQGIELGGNQDVSGMGFLHLDFWSANSASLNVFLISPGPLEKAYSLSVPTSGWSGIDIPLSHFSNVDLTNVFQFKFEGNGDIYIDNILFHK